VCALDVLLLFMNYRSKCLRRVIVGETMKNLKLGLKLKCTKDLTHEKSD